MSVALIVFDKEKTEDLSKLEKLVSSSFGVENFVYFSNKFDLNNFWGLFLGIFIVFPLVFLKSFGKNNIIVIGDGFLAMTCVVVGFLNSKKTMAVIQEDSLLSIYNSRSSFILPDRDFYRILPKLKKNEWWILRSNKWFINYVDVILFYEKELADIWENFYGFSKEKAFVIKTTSGNKKRGKSLAKISV